MRRLLLGLASGCCVAAAAVIGVGAALSSPATRAVGPAPSDLAAESVRIPIAAGRAVAAWFVGGTKGGGAVLLLHGVRADRRAMLARARMLTAHGYAVLLLDLPAHGESDGDRIIFGPREAEGVRAALGYVRQRLRGERIAVIGVSLGAAALVLARPSPPPDAAVLESMYPTIEEALDARLVRRFGAAGRWLSPLLLWQLPLQLGIAPDQLRPIEAIPTIGAPVLIASGTEDEHTTLAETRRVFAVAVEPKALWEVEGAVHVDLYDHGPAAYEARVLPFLHKHLRPGA